MGTKGIDEGFSTIVLLRARGSYDGISVWKEESYSSGSLVGIFFS